jgi:hypothetical protein
MHAWYKPGHGYDYKGSPEKSINHPLPKMDSDRRFLVFVERKKYNKKEDKWQYR